MRFSYLEIHDNECAFSAGHFTVFSATERETLHGHNYFVKAMLKMGIFENGLSFDYRHYKRKIRSLCAELDRYFLLPQHSPHLRLEETQEYWIGHFNQQKIPLLKSDVKILPLTNITIEELSHWFLEKLVENKAELHAHHVHEITVQVFNGPNQSARALWEKDAS